MSTGLGIGIAGNVFIQKAGLGSAITIATLSAVSGKGTEQQIVTAAIQGTSGNSQCGGAVELQLGRYVAYHGQLANADNQNVRCNGITQSGSTLTLSTSQQDIFNGTADLDPYARGQACGAVALNSTQCLIVAPEVGTGNVFKLVEYTGGTSNLSITSTFNDGDTSNYVDRFPRFAVLAVSGSVYTVASVGLTLSGAKPYARVWDVDVSAGSATSRGILYPNGTSGPGAAQAELVKLGTVDGKECFAIFYGNSTSTFGVLYYAVYEYNTSTNTLVEAIGDTFYQSGSNACNVDFQYKIEDGRSLICYQENNAASHVAGCTYDGTTFTVGTRASIGSGSNQVHYPSIRPYYNGSENSTTQFIMGVALNRNSNTAPKKYNVFPVDYDKSANTFDLTEFNGANSEDVLLDTSNTTGTGGIQDRAFIGQQDSENGTMMGVQRDLVGTFRGIKGNSFEMTTA